MYTFIDKIIISYTIFVNLGIGLVGLSKRSRRVTQARQQMRKETDDLEMEKDACGRKQMILEMKRDAGRRKLDDLEVESDTAGKGRWGKG